MNICWPLFVYVYAAFWLVTLLMGYATGALDGDRFLKAAWGNALVTLVMGAIFLAIYGVIALGVAIYNSSCGG